jgi:hypothetical protein
MLDIKADTDASDPINIQYTSVGVFFLIFFSLISVNKFNKKREPLVFQKESRFRII